MMELLAGVVVALAALALVLEPLVTGRARATAAAGPPVGDDDFDFIDVEESESPKIQALLALKEIEFDRETGKLSDGDYMELKAAYQRAALAAIEREATEPATDPGEAVAICPSCGPRPELKAKYCSNCGSAVRVAGDSRRCGGCGTLSPPGAKFCGECGASL